MSVRHRHYKSQSMFDNCQNIGMFLGFFIHLYFYPEVIQSRWMTYELRVSDHDMFKGTFKVLGCVHEVSV